MEKKKIIFIVSILLGIIMMVFIYSKIEDILSPFRGAPIILLLPYSFIVILIHLLHVWRWDVIIKSLGYSLHIKKLFLFRIMGFSINYITPTAHIGGEPIKAAMLKENNVPYTDGVSSLLIDKSFEVTADSFLGICGIIMIALSFAIPKEAWYFFIVLSLICLGVLANLFLRVLKKGMGDYVFGIYRMLKLDKITWLKKIEDKMMVTSKNIENFFLNNKRDFKKSIFISAGMWVLMFLEFKILLLILGYSASALQLFVIISFVGLAYFIPIPAALGVLEAGQITAFTILGLSPALGLATSLVIRAKDMLIAIIGLVLISIKGMKYEKEG